MCNCICSEEKMPVPSVASIAEIGDASAYDSVVVVGSSPTKCATGMIPLDSAIAKVSAVDKSIGREGAVSAVYASGIPGDKAFYVCAGPLNRDYGKTKKD